MPPFTSAYNPRQLLDVVRDVAAQLSTGALTQARFDQARAAAGHPASPSGRQIAKRLGLPWSEVIALALDREDPDRALGRRGGAERDPELSLRDIIFALRLVASHLGRETLIPLEYREEAERLAAEQRRRYRHGRALRLPTTGQIEHLIDWDEALTAAGLEPRPLQAGRAGTPLATAILEAVELYGALPAKRELEWAAQALGRSLRREPWIAAVLEARRRAAAAGRWFPAAPPPLSERPDWTKLPPEAPPRGSRAPRQRSLDDCLDGMRAFLASLGPGERPTLRRYQAYCRGHPGTPWPDSLLRHGGFAAIRKAARA